MSSLISGSWSKLCHSSLCPLTGHFLNTVLSTAKYNDGEMMAWNFWKVAKSIAACSIFQYTWHFLSLCWSSAFTPCAILVFLYIFHDFLLSITTSYSGFSSTFILLSPTTSICFILNWVTSFSWKTNSVSCNGF